jgi:23S rRNA pseudouridine1911/1915/1917 synthase
MQVLSAALGLGRDDAGEFDETYYEEDDYETSTDDALVDEDHDADEDEAQVDDESDADQDDHADHADHEEDDHA